MNVGSNTSVATYVTTAVLIKRIKSTCSEDLNLPYSKLES
jgi:hypothetical protein